VIRVGIAIERAGADWLGGVNYFRNLIGAVNQRPSRTIEIVLLAGEKVDAHGLDNLAETIRTPLLDIGRGPRTLRKGIQGITGTDWLLLQLLKKHGIQLLSHSGVLGRKATIPTLPWIPDFQHIYLPDLFTKEGISRRRRVFSSYVRYGTCILLSSQCAERDLFKFLSPEQQRTKILRFSSCLSINAKWLSKKEIMSRYNVGPRWFHLPNQFWAHKNHRLVIEAIQMAKERGVPLTVLATGATSDARNPEFFSSLMKMVEDNALQNEFRVLGMVPYDDMLSIMRYSVAVINPSRFEGWSTSVEESRSLGKSVLMSDIDVHKEQAPERGVFFSVDDPSSLMDSMLRITRDFCPDEEEGYFSRAMADLESRRDEFACRYESIVHDVMDFQRNRTEQSSYWKSR